jgi:hypothetical protein
MFVCVVELFRRDAASYSTLLRLLLHYQHVAFSYLTSLLFLVTNAGSGYRMGNCENDLSAFNCVSLANSYAAYIVIWFFGKIGQDIQCSSILCFT